MSEEISLLNEEISLLNDISSFNNDLKEHFDGVEYPNPHNQILFRILQKYPNMIYNNKTISKFLISNFDYKIYYWYGGYYLNFLDYILFIKKDYKMVLYMIKTLVDKMAYNFNLNIYGEKEISPGYWDYHKSMVGLIFNNRVMKIIKLIHSNNKTNLIKYKETIYQICDWPEELKKNVKPKYVKKLYYICIDLYIKSDEQNRLTKLFYKKFTMNKKIYEIYYNGINAIINLYNLSKSSFIDYKKYKFITNDKYNIMNKYTLIHSFMKPEYKKTISCKKLFKYLIYKEKPLNFNKCEQYIGMTKPYKKINIIFYIYECPPSRKQYIN